MEIFEIYKWRSERSNLARCVFEFTIAITNDHKLGDVKQHTFTIFYSSDGQKSWIHGSLTGAKVTESPGLCSCLKALEENFFLSFPTSKGAHIPWLTAPFHFQSQQWPIDSHSIILTVTLLPPFSAFKILCDYYVGCSWISWILYFKFNLLATSTPSSDSIFPCPETQDLIAAPPTHLLLCAWFITWGGGP